eukprot:m.574730 g.574730  ORF g.574730 m.574730 type:complete len:863 (-) comp22282_c0_seq4:2603-5191(-)
MDDAERYRGSSHGILDGDYWNRVSLTSHGGRPRRPVRDMYTEALSTGAVGNRAAQEAPRNSSNGSAAAAGVKDATRNGSISCGLRDKRKSTIGKIRGGKRAKVGTHQRAQVQSMLRPPSRSARTDLVKESKDGRKQPGGILTAVAEKGLQFELLWDADQEWYSVEIRSLVASRPGLCTVDYLDSDSFEKIDLRTAEARDLRQHRKLAFVSKDGTRLSNDAVSDTVVAAAKAAEKDETHGPNGQATKSLTQRSAPKNSAGKFSRTARTPTPVHSAKVPLRGLKRSATSARGEKVPLRGLTRSTTPKASPAMQRTPEADTPENTPIMLTKQMRGQLRRRLTTHTQKQIKRNVSAGDIVWVKYARYSECMWPGRVKEVITDPVEALLCRQQAQERLASRYTDAEIAVQRVLCIEWYNHYTRDTRRDTGIDGISNTTNDFLACELTPFTPDTFRDHWRKRSHVRVGNASHLGKWFDRAVFQALMEWEADCVLPLVSHRGQRTSLSLDDLGYLLFPSEGHPKEFSEFYTAHTASETLGDASVHMTAAIQNRWPCPSCSFLNECITSSCSMCGTPRSQTPGSNTSREGRANSRKFKAYSHQQSAAAAATTAEANPSSGPVGSENGAADRTAQPRPNNRSLPQNGEPQRRPAPTSTANGTPSISRKGDTGLRQFEPTGFLGQGMSGSLTKGSVGQVLKAMDLGPGDRFLDLGSGVGHVTLQAALDVPTLEWSRGIEVIEEAWSVAWTNANDLKAIHKCSMAPVYYHLADLQTMDVQDLPDFTHAYVFAAGMPPELQGHLCRLLCKHSSLLKAAIVIDGSLGRGKTSLSTLLLKSGCFERTGKLSACMRGSGSGKTVILFEKHRPTCATT